jgi:photosystem II stability/assembly factor-like uncharacterized protein
VISSLNLSTLFFVSAVKLILLAEATLLLLHRSTFTAISMFKKTSILLLFIFIQILTHAQSIVPLSQKPDCSLRGLSVVNNYVAWASGSKGHVGLTRDGGKTWKWQQVKGFEQSDFRDVEAFSETEAIMMSSGTPALILKTVDGGTTWQVKYRQNEKSFFLDALTFTDSKHGYALGDPIDGRFLLLETEDRGETWRAMSNTPVALPGEAAFAASGTCISTNGKTLNIVTGGSNSRLLSFPIGNQRNRNVTWNAAVLPLLQGKDSEGAFSSVAHGKQQLIIGGDYQDKQRSDSVMCTVYSTGNKVPVRQPMGFQSCIEHLRGSTFISTGTSGSNITTDNGKTWKLIDANSYNVCQKAKHGTLLLLVGDQGKIGIYKN